MTTENADSNGTSVGGVKRISRRSALSRTAIASVVIAVAVGGAFLLHGTSARAGGKKLPAYATIERNGLRYEYDALTGREHLYVVAEPLATRRDVVGERPADVQRLRRELESELGIQSVETLRDVHREEAEVLRRLGYL